MNQRSSKQSARKRPGALAKVRMEKGLARQDPDFKANELVYQRSYKQSARKKTGCISKGKNTERIGKARS